MMREVVAAKPTSAKAHYVLAEILSKEHRFDDAASEARKAREIDPDLKFAGKDPEKFRTFERELQREQTGANTPAQAAPTRVVPAPAVPAELPQAPAPVRASSGGGIPGWVWVVGLAVVAFLIFRAVTRRALANNMATAGYGNAGGYGMQPGQPQPGYGPGYGPAYGQSPGSGLLRTGLAAAGGVAGGMLLEKMLEDRHRDDNSGNGGGNFGGGGSFSDADQAVRDLDNRPIDFGGGGNDWGGDAGGGGGGSDSFGGGGSDDGGGW
jgi:hypothetical protein